MTPFFTGIHSVGRLAPALILLALVLSACERAPRDEPAAEPELAETTQMSSADAILARGERLVAMMDCDGCHTPRGAGPDGPAPDPTRRLAGHPQELHMPSPPPLGRGPWKITAAETMTAFAGSWGITFSANLTPDSTTGLGTWTEDMFSRSMRTGRHWGTGREILPTMPWAAYAHMTDDELHAVYVYLRSLPPIANEVPPYIPPGRMKK